MQIQTLDMAREHDRFAFFLASAKMGKLGAKLANAEGGVVCALSRHRFAQRAAKSFKTSSPLYRDPSRTRADVVAAVASVRAAKAEIVADADRATRRVVASRSGSGLFKLGCELVSEAA